MTDPVLSSVTSTFGIDPPVGLVSTSDVGAAARETLMARLPTHLAALPRPLPAPVSYDIVPTADNIRRVKGAVCAVSANGLRDEPARRGDGTYDAWFVLNVAVFHQHTDAMPVQTATGDYAAAIRQCLLQNPALGGLARAVRWTDESVDLVGDELTPSTLGLAVVEFSVLVRDVVSSSGVGGSAPSSVLSTHPVVSVRTRSQEE